MANDNKRIITITTEHVGVGQEWLSREEIAKKEKDSRKVWDDLSDERRTAVLILMRDAMQRLIEDPNVWVPTSIEAKSGHRLDVFISINLAEVDEEVLRRRVETEELISKTSTDLVVLRDELKPKGE